MNIKRSPELPQESGIKILLLPPGGTNQPVQYKLGSALRQVVVTRAAADYKTVVLIQSLRLYSVHPNRGF